MAYHSAAIEQVIKDHRQWLESNGARGVQLNLSGSDLRKAELGSCNLDGADLTMSSLRDARMVNVKLQGANLSLARADRRTKFTQSNLERVRPERSQSHAERVRPDSDNDPDKKGRGR